MALRPLVVIALFVGPCILLQLRADEPTSVTVGQYVAAPNNSGDTWSPAWTSDNRVFSPSNDGPGFGSSPGTNIHFSEITGSDPAALNGATVNPMLEYGKGAEAGPDKRTWKSSGCLSIDGVLYWVIARHFYDKRQDAKNATIIKSTDEGKTWTPSAQANYDHPMFPGNRFATPYFIVYGQDGHEPVADGSDKYVYALSNNGFWDNGDNMILGRVARSKIGDLNGKDWQFYKGGNGAKGSSWTGDVSAAKLVIDRPDKLGEGGAVYLPKWKCYLMIDWYYPAGGGRVTPDASHTTNWDFFTAKHPWGPWKMIGSHTFTPEAFYCAQVCPKFSSADGNTIWAYTAGDFQNGPQGLYRLVGVPLTLK